MTHQEVLDCLSYAAGHDLAVRITTPDGGEVVGVPFLVDSHPAANEVFLRPLGGDDGEIGMGLAQIVRVELV